MRICHLYIIKKKKFSRKKLVWLLLFRKYLF